MFSVAVALNDFLGELTDPTVISAAFEDLMQRYSDLQKRILTFKDTLENNLSSVEGLSGNSRVEVYKFLKSIRKDFKYFARDISKKIDDNAHELQLPLLTYKGKSNSAWHFVLSLIYHLGPSRMLKPAHHRVSPREGGGYQNEPWPDTFADEFKKIMKSWMPKL